MTARAALTLLWFAGGTAWAQAPGSAPASAPAAEPTSAPVLAEPTSAPPGAEPASAPVVDAEPASAPVLAEPASAPVVAGDAPPAPANDCPRYCDEMDYKCPDVFLGNHATCLATCALYPPGKAEADELRCLIYGEVPSLGPGPAAGMPKPKQAAGAAEAPVEIGPDLGSYYDDHPQLRGDDSVLPQGFGAVFLPSITSRDAETLVSVYAGGQLVAEGPIGRRLVVRAGAYEVRFGTASSSQQITARVRVEAGRTTILPSTWAALEVNVVDPRFIPFRGAYEIIRADTREVLGLGFGADELLGEHPRIWVLRPGLYKLVQAGGNYRDRRNFATVRLLAGQLTRFVLVQDPETTDFIGAGETEIDPPDQRWIFRGIIGGDLDFNRRALSGESPGWGLTVAGFLDGSVRYSNEPHLWILRLDVEEEQTRLPETEDFINLDDRLFLHTIYIYRLLRWFGPYVQASLEAKLLPRHLVFLRPPTVTLVEEDGSERVLDDGERVKIGDVFWDVKLREGTGGNFQVLRSRAAELDLRLGVGARQTIPNGGLEYVPDDQEVVPLRSTETVGVEAAALGLLRITRWVTGTTDLDALIPFDEPEEVLITWRNQASLHLASFVSLAYGLTLIQDPERAGGETQTEHDVKLRFSYVLF